MERFISGTLGKRMIGWEEILEGGLPEDATVMSWKGTECGAKAAATGHDVVMASMADGLYLCAAQGADEVEPAAMGGQSYLKDVYDFEPLPKELAPDKKKTCNRYPKHAYGANGRPPENCWNTCSIPEPWLWRKQPGQHPKRKNWDDFLRRLENMQVRLDLKGINYHIPLPEGGIDDQQKSLPEILSCWNLKTAVPCLWSIRQTDQLPTCMLPLCRSG